MRFGYTLSNPQVVDLDSVDRILGAVVVIAANAGGAWTPIGDVTTTMLWIHGQISTVQTVKVICWLEICSCVICLFESP